MTIAQNGEASRQWDSKGLDLWRGLVCGTPGFMQDRDRGLSEVRVRILERFKAFGVHEFLVFYSSAKELFVAHIFYCVEIQIKESESSGLSKRIKQEIVEELAKVGRGSPENINIVFDFDSHENVEKNYEGDYYLRLR